MQKVVAMVLAATMAVLVSGCALVGRHSVHTATGQKTTVGILAIDSLGDGYPMIPVYTSNELGSK